MGKDFDDIEKLQKRQEREDKRFFGSFVSKTEKIKQPKEPRSSREPEIKVQRDPAKELIKEQNKVQYKEREIERKLKQTNNAAGSIIRMLITGIVVLGVIIIYLRWVPILSTNLRDVINDLQSEETKFKKQVVAEIKAAGYTTTAEDGSYRSDEVDETIKIKNVIPDVDTVGIYENYALEFVPKGYRIQDILLIEQQYESLYVIECDWWSLPIENNMFIVFNKEGEIYAVMDHLQNVIYIGDNIQKTDLKKLTTSE